MVRADEIKTSGSVPNTGLRRIGAPPLPHEHGAWVMLFLPMIVAFAVAPPAFWGQPFLLAVALAGAFMARHPADLLLRGKGDNTHLFWMLAFGLVATAAALILILKWSAYGLYSVIGIAGALFAFHAVLLRWPDRRRLDRSILGEILAVIGLTLSAPAAVVVSRGSMDMLSLILWLACALFFGSGIFHVKTLLSGVKHKGELTAKTRWKIGRPSIAYHIALSHVVIPASALVSDHPLWIVLAYAPVVIRAILGVRHLSRKLPPLKRVGVLETLYSLWFAVWLAAAMAPR